MYNGITEPYAFLFRDHFFLKMKPGKSTLSGSKLLTREMFLPLEIWEMILGSLYEEDRLFCRLVCKDWVSLIPCKRVRINYYCASPSKIQYFVDIGYTRGIQACVRSGDMRVLAILDGHVVWKPKNVCRAVDSKNVEMYKAVERLVEIPPRWKDQVWKDALVFGNMDMILYIYPFRQLNEEDMEYACSSDNVEVVKWLYDKGIGFNRDCLDNALCCVEIMKFIIAHTDLYSRELFFRAVKIGYPEMVEMLATREDRSTWARNDYRRIIEILNVRCYCSEDFLTALFRGGFINKRVAMVLFAGYGCEEKLNCMECG